MCFNCPNKLATGELCASFTSIEWASDNFHFGGKWVEAQFISRKLFPFDYAALVRIIKLHQCYESVFMSEGLCASTAARSILRTCNIFRSSIHELKAAEWILSNMYSNQFMWHAGKLAFLVLRVWINLALGAFSATAPKALGIPTDKSLRLPVISSGNSSKKKDIKWQSLRRGEGDDDAVCASTPSDDSYSLRLC